MGRRTGILGGSFDPIHNGHLAVARAVAATYRLDRILFVPSARPPHKRLAGMTDPDVRAQMVQRAVADESGFELCRVEVDRPGISYTVDTLRRLRSDFPDDAFYMIIGADNAEEFGSWSAPDEVLTLSQVVVAARRGFDRSRVEARLAARMVFLETPLFEISSTDVRERVRREESIEGLVPDAVLRVIQERQLYRSDRSVGGHAERA